MKPTYKFVRIVLGAVMGATLWAGCASNREVAYEPAGAQYVRQPPRTLDRQADMTQWRADTHPEWRTGWNMAFPSPPYCNPRIEDLGVAIDQPVGEAPEER